MLHATIAVDDAFVNWVGRENDAIKSVSLVLMDQNAKTIVRVHMVIRVTIKMANVIVLLDMQDQLVPTIVRLVDLVTIAAILVIAIEVVYAIL